MNQTNQLDLSRAVWRKSTYSSANNECVEVTRNPSGAVAVRDSKNPDGPKLLFTWTQWHAFTTHIKGGRFDPS
jgi:hypothetical protein